MSSDSEAESAAASSHKIDTGDSGDNEALSSLRRILAEQSHLFACGGDIPIRNSTSPAEGGGQDEQRKSDPITIRWDLDGTGDDRACAKLSLPPAQGTEAGLDRLLHHSRPATFGRGGQDVYDESYRKALQMDPAAFCTTFDPYSVGIVDVVAQVLLPSVCDSTTHRGVRAELYKLNVYSGPSGRFKPHVDTPRSASQFGSLVVCLPVAHEGGFLQVRHKELEVTFDWSTNQEKPNDDSIGWAAFYSDCEHEVLEVTSGHRLTLTYNLYAVRGAGRLTGVSPTLNPASMPLFKALKETLSQGPFGGRGGTIGFWCSHTYAYNHTKEAPLPATLKGADAVLWESLQALGLNPKVAPVITMSADVRESFSECYDDADPDPWPYTMRLRKKLPSAMPSEWIVGFMFGVHVDSGWQTESLEDYHNIYQRWGSYTHEPVRWLTMPKQSELQLVYTAYGNQANAGAMYSNCAILVDILPRE
ncbi:oxidoreductase [Colletotrichum phormii]|uniref:Oxidoreductase n=1 Tax=Colletotrichum phormii TaxID=359342 RepID=A0AAJ0A0B1_9PEZI|nr:oxidoreductase [Colletotrichum phormii]KAK1641521.1 oxidoreductase [Colletotrichum phormii]